EAEVAAADSDDPDQSLEAAIDFYRAVTEYCGSDLFAVFGAVLQTLLVQATYFGRGLPPPDGRTLIPSSELLTAHARLVELIVEGDAAGAEAHWRRHIEELEAAFPELRSVR